MAAEHPGEGLKLAPLGTRWMSLLYEGVLLFAVVFVTSYLFISLARDAQSGWLRFVFQIYLLAVCGAYFLFCWLHGGQTLPMKTWHMRLVTVQGKPLSARQALLRYVCAVPGIALLGVGLAWAFLDPEKQFLHDRLAGTRIIRMGD